MSIREKVLIEAARRAREENLTPRQAFLYSVLLEGPKPPSQYSPEQLEHLGIENHHTTLGFEITDAAYEKLTNELFPSYKEEQFKKYTTCTHCGAEVFWATQNPICEKCKRKNFFVGAVVVVIALICFASCIRT